MKINYLLILAITFSFFFKAIAQDKVILYGSVKYKFKPNDYLEKIEKDGNDYFKNLYSDTENMRLVLKFNDIESLFEMESQLENDMSPMTLKVINSLVIGGSYYTNLKEKSVIRKTNNGGEEFLISIVTDKETEWKISKEFKMINKYKCFKATRNKTIVNNRSSHIFEIIAWFTPEISAKYGPKEYNSLPGLILELYDTHHIYFVDEIKFFKSPIKITPFKGKIVTEEEYLDISRKGLNNFKESIKKG